MKSVFQKNNQLVTIWIVVFFINLILYSICSILDFPVTRNWFWYLRIPILFVIYLLSNGKNFIYITSLFLYQIASLLFAFEGTTLFTMGSIASLSYKICLLYLLIPIFTKKEYLKISLACLPLFIIYLFIIDLVALDLSNTKYLWIINALTTSIIGGVAIIYYNKNYDLKGYWLIISSILFIIQIGAFFINKFYLKNGSIYQMVIFSSGISHFAFYKFMILKEEEEKTKKMSL